jgi:formate hydrogenlyase subunit 6/NADH:ubiquinone oxidoreductase subunit I
MTTQAERDAKFYEAAGIIARAGVVPFQVSPTLVEIAKHYLDEGQADFIIRNFADKATLSVDELRASSGLGDEELERVTSALAGKGILFNQPNTRGVMVYRLLPFIVVGAFEYTFMRALPEGEKRKDLERLAGLYQALLGELRDFVQGSYDELLPLYEYQPPVDRTVPVLTSGSGRTIAVNQAVEAVEHILPTRTVEEIINKYDDIAVGHCFCRNYTQVLGRACATGAPSEVCITFGKSARHVVNQGFARRITREEALRIMRQAEEAGLVHKAFHNGSNIEKEENSVCNCCKDCCDTFTLWRNGAAPLINATMHLSVIDPSACTGCEVCVERCPVDAIAMRDGVAVREEAYCIGCGVCARFCAAEAISLQEGLRRVCVPPPRLRT